MLLSINTYRIADLIGSAVWKSESHNLFAQQNEKRVEVGAIGEEEAVGRLEGPWGWAK